MNLRIVASLASCLAGLPVLAPVHFPTLAGTELGARATAGATPWSAPAATPATTPMPGPAAAAASSAAGIIIIEPLPPPPVTVTLRNINSEEIETFAIVPDGRVDGATATSLTHFFRCRRTQREKPIAAGTLALLVSVAQHWPGRVIDIVSGFRAPPFGAPHSKHFRGYAIDLRVEGVKTSTLRDVVWREHHEVGVGHYTDENFVHMDWRPGESDRAWSSRSESDDLEYNPRWAWAARHPARRRASTSPRS